MEEERSIPGRSVTEHSPSMPDGKVGESSQLGSPSSGVLCAHEEFFGGSQHLAVEWIHGLGE